MNDVKFERVTSVGKTMEISEVSLGEPYRINHESTVTPVTLKISSRLSEGEDSKIQEAIFVYNGKELTAPINVKCYREKHNEMPFLLNSFEVFDDSSKLVFEMTNRMDKVIRIHQIECGSDIKIKQHNLIKSEGNIPVEESIEVKPGEMVKQEMVFERDSKALTEITLRFHTVDVEGIETFSFFSFGYPGTTDIEEIKKVLQPCQ